MNTENTIVEFTDGLINGGGVRRLWLVSPAGQVVLFRGESIPGTVVVMAAEYVKDGKWSRTEHRLAVKAGWSAVQTGYVPTPGFASWTEFGDWFAATAGRDIDTDSFRSVASAEFTKTAERLAAVESAMADL